MIHKLLDVVLTLHPNGRERDVSMGRKVREIKGVGGEGMEGGR